MNNKVLSIAIPTYNMEKYLNRCVDSLLAPEILSKIEVLIVNDGSKDSSLLIAKAYETQYPDSVKVIDKPNGNYGSCINAALKVASGKYFRILDADDWFDSQNLVKLINHIEHIDADMVITNFAKEYTDGHSEVAVKGTHKIPSENICTFNQYDFDGLGVIYLLAMHSLTYRTQLLRDMGYRQTEGISYTDTEYCFYPLAYVRSFIFFDFVLYRYYYGHEGQTISDSAIRRNKNQFYQISRNLIEYLQTNQDNNDPVVRKQQYAIVERISKNYYFSVLVFNERNDEENAKLSGMDKQIKALDKDLYNNLYNYEYHGIKYISQWRKKGVYYSDPGKFLFHKLYLKVRFSLKKSRFLFSLYHKASR